MADPGHDETEEMIREVGRKVRREYLQALTETQEKLEDYLRRFEAKDSIKRGQAERGEITQKEYAAWRRNQILVGERWQEMADNLAEDYTNASKAAMSIVRGHTPDAYAANFNYGTYQVESEGRVDTAFTLYDRQTVERLLRDEPDLLPAPRVSAPKEKRWNRQHVVSAVTQGILQGESLDKVARRLQSVADMDFRAAMRNARTAMTGAQNAGRTAAYQRAQEMGIQVRKRWMATLDMRTRHAHRRLDGETVPMDERFSNGLRYPGDPYGEAGEVYNCRCTLVPDLPGVDAEESGRASKLGGMTYDEWKQEHRDRTILTPDKSIEQTNVIVDTGPAFNAEEFANRFPSASYEEEDKSDAVRRAITDFNSVEAKHLTDSDAKSIYERQKESISGIDELEKKAYSKEGYFGGNSYDAINGGLRRGDLDTGKHGDVVDALDRMIAGSVLDEDTALIRYASVDEVANAMGISEMDFYSTSFEEVRSALVGRELVDEAYTSTAYKGTVRTLAEQPVRMNFIARKGTNAYVRRDGEESEVLLGRGIKKHVVGVRQIRYFDWDLMDAFDDEDMAWGTMYIIDVVV